MGRAVAECVLRGRKKMEKKWERKKKRVGHLKKWEEKKLKGKERNGKREKREERVGVWLAGCGVRGKKKMKKNEEDEKEGQRK